MPRRKNLRPVAFLWLSGLWLVGCGLFVMASAAGAQTLEDAQRDFLHGKYDEVIKTATKQVAAGDYSDDWRVLLVKSLLIVGRYADAHTNALAFVDDYSGVLEKRLLARETFLYQNDPAGANQQLMEMQRLIVRRSRELPNEDPEDPVSLGR